MSGCWYFSLKVTNFVSIFILCSYNLFIITLILIIFARKFNFYFILPLLLERKKKSKNLRQQLPSKPTII